MNGSNFQFSEIEAGYNGRQVLRRVSGELRPNGRVAVIGPNGCGKSTLLRVLMGVHPATGVVAIGGTEVSRASAMDRNRLGLGCMRQGVNVFPSLTGRENLEMAFTGHSIECNKRIVEVSELLPATKQSMNRRAGLLSGGMRQSLALAMVLMNRPKVLLLDEPLAGLSPKAADSMIDSLNSIHSAEGVAWMIVEHRLPLVRRAVDAVWIMREGQFIHITEDVAVLEDPDELSEHFQLT